MMMIYLLVVGFLAIALQMTLPLLHVGGVSFSVFLVPIVVLYGALWTAGDGIFLVTVVLGFGMDFLTPGASGASAVSLSALAALAMTQRHFHWIRQLWYQALLAFVGTCLWLVLDYVFYNWQLEQWRWPLDVWVVVYSASFAAAALAPPAFWVLNQLPRRLGFAPRIMAAPYVSR